MIHHQDPQQQLNKIYTSGIFDMKNSLNMLISTLDHAIESTPSNDIDQAKRNAIMQYEAWRMNAELIKMITLQRLAQGELQAHVEECYLIETLEEQLALNHTLLEISNIRICIYESDFFNIIVKKGIRMLGSIRRTDQLISIKIKVDCVFPFDHRAPCLVIRNRVKKKCKLMNI